MPQNPPLKQTTICEPPRTLALANNGVLSLVCFPDSFCLVWLTGTPQLTPTAHLPTSPRYTYVTAELPALVTKELPAKPGVQSVFGHSMGGHGALICALKNPGMLVVPRMDILLP